MKLASSQNIFYLFAGLSFGIDFFGTICQYDTSASLQLSSFDFQLEWTSISMHDSKVPGASAGDESNDAIELSIVTQDNCDKRADVKNDERDMQRMGKKQELLRDFQFWSIWGYAVVLGSSWQYALITGVLSLANGGTAGAVWTVSYTHLTLPTKRIV